MTAPALDLAAWTHDTIRAECRVAYNRYSHELDLHYATYFAGHPEERGNHLRQAADLERALPAGWDHLVDELPQRVRHVHHLSGRSSQVLALSVLGASARLDPSLNWLWQAFSPLLPTDAPLGLPRFERELAPEALNEERGRVTSIDFYAETSDLVICVEAKRGEDGMGRCSCPPGAPKVAGCSDKVLNRPLYWRAAYDIFGLPDREPGRYCPVSTGYQAVRSVAAAKQLATAGRRPVFGLIYDADNPYFGGVGAWPGWPRVLEHTLRGHESQTLFRAVSWQELLPLLPIDDMLRSWMTEKHRLG